MHSNNGIGNKPACLLLLCAPTPCMCFVMAPLASEALNTTFLAEEEIAPLLHASAQVLLLADGKA